jgi:hypothetical protein
LIGVNGGNLKILPFVAGESVVQAVRIGGPKSSEEREKN